jgi:predicted choloylglycine hydrolase
MTNISKRQPALDVICAGSSFEMGLAQGTALRERIRLARAELRLLEAFRNEQPRWIPYPLFLAYAERKVASLVRPGMIEKFPGAHDRLRGIAEGASVSINTLYLLDGLEALMASVEGRIRMPALAACSAIAVRGQRSADGQPMIARNFDYLPVVQPFYTLRESRPAGGMRSLEFTTAPLAGAIDGMNEAGLCITYNYAFALDIADRLSGTISMAISEALAKCQTVTEAANWIASRPRWGGGLLMLADPSGDIASLELSNTRSRLRRPADGENVIHHTNCFAQPEMRAVEVPADATFTDRAPTPLRGKQVLKSANCRRERLKTLLAAEPVLGSKQLQRILSDHGATGQPSDDSLCMHSGYWNTTASLQWFPKRRSLRISYSSTCQANYAELQLS